MSLPLPGTTDTLRRQIEMLDTQLDQAIINAEKGRRPDIRTFQKSATLFCDYVVKLPPAEARTFQSAIADMIRKLDALEKALHHQG